MAHVDRQARSQIKLIKSMACLNCKNERANDKKTETRQRDGSKYEYSKVERQWVSAI